MRHVLYPRHLTKQKQETNNPQLLNATGQVTQYIYYIPHLQRQLGDYMINDIDIAILKISFEK